MKVLNWAPVWRVLHGRQHAGENLADVLKKRAGMAAPIQCAIQKHA